MWSMPFLAVIKKETKIETVVRRCSSDATLLKKGTLAQVFSCKFSEISNNFSYWTPQVAGCLCKIEEQILPFSDHWVVMFDISVLTHFVPWTLSIPPENIRKPEVLLWTNICSKLKIKALEIGSRKPVLSTLDKFSS